ncbi:DNA-binding protein [Leptospira sp. 201903070]|uniref:DNA-binding protein n=2 Tax=Leptospira ainlahdjerensis TaxID=2810033 RepID=A0ABS2UBI3_9LEPT|nr:DNA-binding protein [Leptospira ainlahdjerensis]MBM9577717.1 DNA-binding protein [Leptospira ainlahdjerensis]
MRNFAPVVFFFFLLLSPLCFFDFSLDAKSVLLKNGRKIENVKIKPVANGFEISHANGKTENIPLSKVLKIFVSDGIPKSSSIPRTSDSQTKTERIEEPSKEKELFLEVADATPKRTSGLKSFSEGLIPGWSRLVRSDSYAWKSVGFFFILAELYLAERSYVYLSKPKPLSESDSYSSPPEVYASILSRDTNLILATLAHEYYSISQRVELVDGQILQRGRYFQERNLYVSGFLFVLLLDAFLGYKLEEWTVVPSVRISFLEREKEISGGFTVRF